jgi:hypothetical protein
VSTIETITLFKWAKHLNELYFMRYIFSLCLVLTLFNPAHSQNLISNGGFESGTSGWTNWWSRDGQGSAKIVTSPVHTGNNALEVTFNGSQDWSFGVNKDFAVKPGDIFELSAWVNAELVHSDAQLSVELKDSLGKVIDWVYGTCGFEETNGQYKQFSSKFIVPNNVRKINPRLMGTSPCHFFVDDVSMSFIGNTVVSSKTFTLENEKLKSSISYPSMKIVALNKLNNKLYETEPLSEYLVNSIDSSVENRLVVNAHHVTENFDINFVFSLSGNSLSVQLKADSSLILKNSLRFPGAISSGFADYLVVPRGTGVIWPVDKDYPFNNYVFWDWKSTMSFVGVTNLKSGYMIVSDDPWDTETTFSRTNQSGLLNPEMIHHSAKGKWSYDRNLHYVFVNDGYNEMCEWYKQFAASKGYRKTLIQKAVENPNMNRLKGAVDFWLNNLTFSSAEADNFIKYGLDRAIFSLNTWENSLPKLIDSLNSKGFLTSRYDIFTDVWPDSIYSSVKGYRREGFPDEVILKKNGNLQEGWLAYVDGNPFQGYVICSETHSDYATKTIAPDLYKNRYNCRFIDVELASGLKECYSPEHPVTRKTDAQARVEALNMVKNDFNLVTGAEEARDFAFMVTDYGEGTMTINPPTGAGYDWSTPIDPINNYEDKNLNPAMRVPLHGLVYHDVHIPTWYTGDGVSKVPSLWDDKDLFNILYATMPLFMPPNQTYWLANREKFLSSYHLISSITRNVAFDEMSRHTFISDDKKIQQTVFSNGWEVTVNFDSIPHPIHSKLLAAKGFYATDGNTQQVFRIVESNSTLAVADIDNRLFINPYEVEKTYKGIKTTGTVFLRNDETGIHLAFIGKQKYILFNPSQMDWRLGHAYSENTGKQIPLIQTEDGWLLLNRPANESFVRFDLDTTELSNHTLLNTDNLFECYPNPATNRITVTFNLKQSENVQLAIYNMLGQSIKVLYCGRGNIGYNRFEFEIGDLPATSYILKLKSVQKSSAVMLTIQ